MTYSSGDAAVSPYTAVFWSGKTYVFFDLMEDDGLISSLGYRIVEEREIHQDICQVQSGTAGNGDVISILVTTIAFLTYESP